MLDIAIAVDQRADLTVYFARQFGQMAGEFLSDDLARRDATLVEFFQSLNLARLESLKVSFDVADDGFLRKSS
jgi:hypothetical protein